MTPRQLPKYHIEGNVYYLDERLSELRRVDNPFDAIRLTYWSTAKPEVTFICEQTTPEGEPRVLTGVSDDQFTTITPRLCGNTAQLLAALHDPDEGKRSKVVLFRTPLDDFERNHGIQIDAFIDRISGKRYRLHRAECGADCVDAVIIEIDANGTPIEGDRIHS